MMHFNRGAAAAMTATVMLGGGRFPVVECVRFLRLHLDQKLNWNNYVNIIRANPINQKNGPNVFPYMALYWANVLAIVPTLGQFT